LDSVRDLDEKFGDYDKKEATPETDITGFSVLLNACKPAILETRPPMRLNVVREVEKKMDYNQNDTGSV
jgi:hypothetical protein